MRHYLEKSYQDLFTGSTRLSIAASGVSSIISPVDGIIREIRLYITSPSGGTSVWNVRVNGVAIWTGGARPDIVAPAIGVIKTGLTTAVLKGQIIRLDLEDPGVSGVLLPITTVVVIDDNSIADTPYELAFAASDETTSITTGTAEVTVHVDTDFELIDILVGLSVVSSSGIPQFNIKKNGTTIFTTNITIDASEFTNLTAAAAYVLTTDPTTFVRGDKLQIDFVAAGTGAKGAKFYIRGRRT